jgi:hypothetical protein
MKPLGGKGSVGAAGVLSTTYLSVCLLVQFPPTLSHSCFVEMLLLLACCIIKGGLQVGS